MIIYKNMQPILIKDKDGKLKILHANTKISDDDVQDVQNFVDHRQQIFQSQIDEYIKNLAENITAQFSKYLGNYSEKFKAIIITALKEVRNNFDVKDILQRPFDQGGLNLDIQVIDQVLQQVDLAKKKIFEKQQLLKKNIVQGITKNKQIQVQKVKPGFKENFEKGLEKLRKMYVSNENYNLQQNIEDKTKKDLPKKQGAENLPENKGRAKEVPDKKQDLELKPLNIVKKRFAKPINKKPKKPVHLKPPANPILVKTESKNVSMIDIVPPEQALKGYVKNEKQDVIDTRVKLVGPIDELRLMDLGRFRQISPDVQTRISKIKEKFNLLEENSYLDRMKGIKAWQESKLYNLYVEMGYYGLKNNKTLDEVIKIFEDQSKPHLTKQEFFAINEINKSLVF